MKFIQLTLIAILFFGLSTSAQQKVSGKAIIKTPGLTCETCKDRVERSLFKMYGITSVKADFKKHTTTVTWLTDRTNIEEIKTAIANAGYDADDVTAEEDAYKRLPAGCKKPVVVATPAAPVKTEPAVVPAPVVAKPVPSTKPVVAPINNTNTDAKKKAVTEVKKKPTK
jgi:periplasmic mercuric ion binding protein